MPRPCLGSVGERLQLDSEGTNPGSKRGVGYRVAPKRREPRDVYEMEIEAHRRPFPLKIAMSSPALTPQGS
jgi:hypothetical protein